MTRVVLKNVRLAFPDLFEAVQYKGTGPLKYRANFVMAPDSKAKADVDAAILAAAVGEWNGKAKETLERLKAAERVCLIDGNTKTYNGYSGNFVLTATRNPKDGKPAIVNRNPKVPVTAEDGIFYAGCEVNAVVDIWAHDSFKGGVRSTLVTVQFVKDNDSFGGAAPATADGVDDLSFDDDESVI